MLECTRTRRHLLPLIMAALPLAQVDPARAFDTGPHSDMTRSALQDEGFAPESPVIGIAQVSNWLVDYYSARPSLGDAQLERMARELAKLHFDSLTTPAQIRNVWNRLTLNTQLVVTATAAGVRSSSDERERYTTLVALAVMIGTSLHPVQDFYSHSNWVELYPMRGGAYGTRTWFDTESPSAALHTGLVGSGANLDPTGDPARDHGGYDAGMNHDSYSRPGYAEAYVYGYSASRQWIRAIRQWVEQVDPAVWGELLMLQLEPGDATALNTDLDYAYYLSLWVSESGKNGAWKGRGSGSGTSFVKYSLGWWAFAPTSIVVGLFRDAEVSARVARGMDQRNTDPGAAPAMPHVALRHRVVEVRTLRASVTSGAPDLIGGADLFAVIVINGQPYTEATQQGSDDVQPAWLSIAMVPDSLGPVFIRYDLYDEDDFDDSEQIDVSLASGRKSAQFQLDMRTHQLSGDLRGIHDSEPSAATLRGDGGDGDTAEVTLYVTAHELGEEPDPGPQATP